MQTAVQFVAVLWQLTAGPPGRHHEGTVWSFLRADYATAARRLGAAVPVCGAGPSIYTDATAYRDWIEQTAR